MNLVTCAGKGTSVRAGLARWTLGLCLACVFPAQCATVVHRPYLQNLQGDHVTILWSTKENLTGELQYSTDRGLSNPTRIPISGGKSFPQSLTKSSYDFYQYRADITGLTAGTAYYYRVVMGGQDITLDVSPQFRTPGPGPFRFLVFGDSGAGTTEQLNVLNQMLKEQPDMVIHVGDIAYENGTFDEFHDNHFEYYFQMMAHLPFFPAPGNHEYNSCLQGLCPPAMPYFSLHWVPAGAAVSAADKARYYSYDWGDVHFVALDANILLPDAPIAELTWLDADLAATTAKWKIVYWHQTPYALLHHADDPLDIASAKWFVPILEKYGAQLVLTGHEHEYFRSKPMHGGVPVTSGPSTLYITSGGGGGGLHPVQSQPWVASGCAFPASVPSGVRPPDAAAAQLCEASWWEYLRVDVSATQITVHAIDMNGVEFDTVTLSLPSVSPGGVVNTATYTPSVAAGGLVSIFGQGMAGGIQAAAQYPLPTTLAGTTVTLNGNPLALFYVSPQQINAQLPAGFVGSATLQVSSGAGVSAVPISVSATAPAVFQSGVLHHNSGAPVSSASPAIAGEVLDVYLTGLGQVNGTLAIGQAAPEKPPLSVVTTVTVDIGTSSPLSPIFSGLTPGLAGVYQVSIALPQDLPTNVYPLCVLAQGSPSNVEQIQVRARTP